MARNSKVKNTVRQVVRKSRRPSPAAEKPSSRIFFPAPSSLLSCACTDTATGGFSLGRMVNLIGDSSSGKTFVALSVFAEMAQRKEFDNYRFIFDDVENADDFNTAKLFGKEVARRIEAPYQQDGEPVPSDTIEDFHFNIADALDGDQPFLYVLDSFDALDAKQDQEKIESMRAARTKGNKVAGSYAMSKPKKSSELLRNICGKLKRTNSGLIIISQTRDNIDPMSFEKKTRSGGKALKFYAHHEIWLAMAGKIVKRDRVIGNKVKAKVSKNKVTGKVREVAFPIFYDYGVDDIKSSIEWLVAEGFWKKTKLTIHAEELGLSGTADKLVKAIEEKGQERQLKKIVEKGWVEIEEGLKLNRKSKYA